MFFVEIFSQNTQQALYNAVALTLFPHKKVHLVIGVFNVMHEICIIAGFKSLQEQMEHRLEAETFLLRWNYGRIRYWGCFI